jgi:hypothetical protein
MHMTVTLVRLGGSGADVGLAVSAGGHDELCRDGEHLCTEWNIHSCFLDFAGHGRRVFSIVLVGNQIAEYFLRVAMSWAHSGARR